jgi:hypothetical protein
MTMSCTLATIAACFSLSGVYVDTGLDYQDVGVWRTEYRADPTVQRGGVIESGGRWISTNRSQNPYGRLALGYQMDMEFGQSKVIFTLAGYHESSIATGNDRGVNGVTFGARYFPFARQ